MTKRKNKKKQRKKVAEKVEVRETRVLRPKFRLDARGINTLGAGLQVAQHVYENLDRMSIVFYSDRDKDVDASILLERFSNVNDPTALSSFKVQGAYLREDGWTGDYNNDLKHLCARLIPILSGDKAEIRGYDCFIRTEGDHYTNFEMKDVNSFMLNLVKIIDEAIRSIRK